MENLPSKLFAQDVGDSPTPARIYLFRKRLIQYDARRLTHDPLQFKTDLLKPWVSNVFIKRIMFKVLNDKCILPPPTEPCCVPVLKMLSESTTLMSLGIRSLAACPLLLLFSS